MGIFWSDYLAADRTCDLDTLPRMFGLMPERFSHRLTTSLIMADAHFASTATFTSRRGKTR
jgi:hypothetical protein